MSKGKAELDSAAMATYRMSIALVMTIANQYDLKRLLSVSAEEQALLLHMRDNRVDPRVLKSCLESEAV